VERGVNDFYHNDFYHKNEMARALKEDGVKPFVPYSRLFTKGPIAVAKKD
jgi:hypothetical protein